MNTLKVVPILAILALVLIAMSGCTGPNYGTQNTSTNTGDNTGTVTTAPTADTWANELSSGTGTGSNDVTTQELDDLQNNADEMDVTADESEASNI